MYIEGTTPNYGINHLSAPGICIQKIQQKCRKKTNYLNISTPTQYCYLLSGQRQLPADSSSCTWSYLLGTKAKFDHAISLLIKILSGTFYS